MASNNLPTIILLFSLLVYSASYTDATCGCTKPTTPTPSPPPAHKQQCPRDTLKLGICADILGLVHVVVGNPPSGSGCCPLLKGLTDLEAALCLCTAIKGNVLGLNLDVPVALTVILSACQKTVPSGFQCA